MNQLRAFQREDVDAIKDAGMCAFIASSQGTGKTPVAICALSEFGALPALIVCPASVTHNWAREFEAWAPGIETILVDSVAGKITRPHHNHFALIVSWQLFAQRWRSLVKLCPKIIVADELQNAKNPEALRSKALMGARKHVDFCLGLTGTPVINVPEEFDVLKSYIRKDKSTEGLLVLRRLLEVEAPDIPPKKRGYVRVALRPRHRAAYDKAEKDFEIWVAEQRELLAEDGKSDFEIERSLASEALQRIGRLRRMVGVQKVPAATDWISRAARLGEPVVVFLEHQEALRRLSQALHKQRIRHVVYEGSCTINQRQQAVDDFQSHRYPVFLGTKAAMVGITLTRARHLLFMERYWTSSDEEQAEDRIRRIGQKHRTNIWYLHAVDTVDDRIDQIVKTKRKIVHRVIGSASIKETPESNMQSLLATWGQQAEGGHKVQDLGLGKPFPPIPSPAETHALFFTGTRWSETRSRLWGRMHGFQIDPQARPDAVRAGLRWTIHPAAVFRKGTFEAVVVAKDIHAIVGKRVSSANERLIRDSLKSY